MEMRNILRLCKFIYFVRGLFFAKTGSRPPTPEPDKGNAARLDLASVLGARMEVRNSPREAKAKGKSCIAGSPSGGINASGHECEGGVWGIEEFLEVKATSGWMATPCAAPKYP